MPGEPRLTVDALPRRAVMGIVNVTPDSFSDGGRYLDPDIAIAHGRALARAGAAIVDIGGVSTRPGADAVPADEELRRVLPVVAALRDLRCSIDTTSAQVARAALDAGALMVNDISGGTADPEMLGVVAEAGAAFVAMHMRGTPRTMQQQTEYDDVVAEVGAALASRVAAAVDAGVDRRAILADPGIGFAKDAPQNLALLRALPDLAAAAAVPLLVGASRKSFLGHALGSTAAPRDDASLAAAVWAFEHGAAVVRVHDVAATHRAVALLETLERAA